MPIPDKTITTSLAEQAQSNQRIVESYDKAYARSVFESIALSWCKLHGVDPQAKTPDGMIESVKKFHEACEDAGYEIGRMKHARSEMDKVNDLQDRLSRGLGMEPRAGEWLSQYRKYLDGKGIKAEENGWPSAMAHSQFNVLKFIKHMKESM